MRRGALWEVFSSTFSNLLPWCSSSGPCCGVLVPFSAFRASTFRLRAAGHLSGTPPVPTEVRWHETPSVECSFPQNFPTGSRAAPRQCISARASVWNDTKKKRRVFHREALLGTARSRASTAPVQVSRGWRARGIPGTRDRTCTTQNPVAPRNESEMNSLGAR